MTEHSIKAEDDTGADPANSMIDSSCSVQGVTSSSPMLSSGRKRKQDLQYPGNGASTTADTWPTTTSVDGNPTTTFEYPPTSSWSSSSNNSNNMQQYKHSTLLHDDHHDAQLVVNENAQGMGLLRMGSMQEYVTLHDI